MWFTNPSSAMDQSLRAARRSVKFWLDFEDFVRHLDLDLGKRVGRDMVSFTKQDWIAFNERIKPESVQTKVATERAFVRWKGKAREAGAPFPADAARQDGFLVSPSFVSARAEEAIARKDELERAAGRAREPEPARRDTPIKNVFKRLRIPYGGLKTTRWISAGMPVRVEERGTRLFYFGDTAEIDEWVREAADQGLIADPFGTKIPIEEAQPRLARAISSLGVTKSRLAKMVGSTPAKIHSYLVPPAGLRSVPLKVVVEAEELARRGTPEVRKRRPLAGGPTLIEVREAIEQSGGNVAAASRLLAESGFTAGITDRNLGRIARRYQIPIRIREVVKPGPAELKRVLVANDYNLSATAAEFGFSAGVVKGLLQDYNLSELVDKFGRGKVTKDRLIRISEVSRFDTVRASDLLRVSRSHFRILLNQHGIAEWFDDQRANHEWAVRYEEAKSLVAAIKRAVKKGKHRGQLAKSLGYERAALENRLRTLGIYEEYQAVRQDPGLRTRPTCALKPGAKQVPFWLAALRDLRGSPTYSGRGGGRKLAKKLGLSSDSVTNWLKGVRVPGPKWIRRIMEVAGLPMPDWRERLEEIVARYPNRSEAARAIGIAPPTIFNLLAGRGDPSEKLLQLILGPEFFVAAPPEPETGATAAASMGQVLEAARDATSQAVVELLGTYRSQRALAQDLGVTVSSVSRYAHGKSAPRHVTDRLVELYQERLGRPPAGIEAQVSSRELLQRALGLYPTQTALAQELGLTRGHLSRILGGHVGVSNQVRARLIDLLKDLGERRPNPG